MNQAAQTPFARENIPTAGISKPSVNILTPVVQSGTVDVSDIAHLSGEALRKVLVARAAALVPLLEANAIISETNRRAADENIAAIRAAGLYKIMVPRRYGGLETDMKTMIAVSAELAKGCGGTAWVTTLLNVCSWFTGLGPAQLQDDVWGANPEARIAGVFAPLATTKKVEGGFIVTGKWPWASGSLHADWAVVGLPIVNAAGEEIDQGFTLIPMSKVTIEESWFVAGMKASGSNTIVADGVFVPDHHIMSVPKLIAGEPPTPYKDEVLYRSAFVPVAAMVLAGPQVGLCQKALDFVIEKAPKRGISYTFYKKQTESPSFQLAVAKAAMLVQNARLLAYYEADEIDKAAQENRLMDYTDRARSRMAAGYVGKIAREAIDILLSAHGASSFGDTSPMQRIWRDSETAGRHAVISPEIGAEVYGRALMGITDGVTALV